jgi:hypothetical protein
MALKQELLGLDHERLGTAIGTVVAKIAFEPGGRLELAAQLNAHQPALSALPDAVSETLEAAASDTFEDQQLATLCAGMTLLASVLCEYAELEEMQGLFPDMPDA